MNVGIYESSFNTDNTIRKSQDIGIYCGKSVKPLLLSSAKICLFLTTDQSALIVDHKTKKLLNQKRSLGGCSTRMLHVSYRKGCFSKL